MAVKPFVSIIIPTLNEAHQILSTLEAIEPNTTPNEVIVVDGGSSDGTAELAEKKSDRVLRAMKRNRAEKIADAVRRRQVVGGAFARRYASPSMFLRATCLLAELRGRMFGWFLGDQAIFVRTEVFDALGGFREWEIFEDLDFSRRMGRIGRVVTLRPPVVSSARRFSDRGAVRTTLCDFWLTCQYLLGKPSIARRLQNHDSS